MRLTDKERELLANGALSRDVYVRDVANWQEILADMTPTDAAARIFGDLICFNPDRGIQRRDGALADVKQLAQALQAWAEAAPRSV